MARRKRDVEQTTADESAPPKGIRYVLSERAVRRLRTADAVMEELWHVVNAQCPAWIANSVAHAYLSLTEAVDEIDRSNVEAAA